MILPHFSFIVPCYNQGHFLKKAVESIIQQGFQDWELWIINDGSTDNTEKIAHDLSKSDPRVKVINQLNLGLSAARNAGLNVAKGSIINFLDADDWLLPGSLGRIAEKWANPNIDILITGYSYFINNEIIHSHSFKSEAIPFCRVIEENIAPPVAFFIKKEVFETIGLFDISLKSCEDWDLWIRGAKSGFRFYTIPGVFVAYRYVMGSMSKRPEQMYESLCQVTSRACKIDQRLSLSSPFNVDFDMNLVEQYKLHFIKCLGVRLFQKEIENSISWYKEETRKFNWSFDIEEWKGVSSSLSFRYFLTPNLISQLLVNTMPVFSEFYKSIGYTPKQTQKILEKIFLPQLKKKNHLKYGKFFGGLVNKIRY